MKYRKLRIAFSSLCAVICVTLIALWVHSYFGHALLTKRLATYTLSLRTDHGELGIWSVSPPMAEALLLNDDWDVSRLPVTFTDLSQLMRSDADVVEFFEFRYAELTPVARVLFIPFWALLLPIAAAGAAPWISGRIGWRTTFSAACVLTTLVLIAFWIRSYRWADITDRKLTANFCSMNGHLLFNETFMITGKFTPGLIPPIPVSHLGICSLNQDKFDLLPFGVGTAIPYWLITIIVAPIAAVPWLRLRFSLRTMLIGTALVAVVLTLAIFAVRR